MDVDKCVDAWRAFSKRLSEIRSLGLQKFIVVVVLGFSLSLLLHLRYY
jgi:hypothetical protein